MSTPKTWRQEVDEWDARRIEDDLDDWEKSQERPGEEARLYVQAAAGNAEAVEKLLKEVPRSEWELNKALGFAVEAGHAAVCRILRHAGADACHAEGRFLRLALRSGNAQTVRAIVENGGPTSCPGDIGIREAVNLNKELGVRSLLENLSRGELSDLRNRLRSECPRGVELASDEIQNRLRRNLDKVRKKDSVPEF